MQKPFDPRRIITAVFLFIGAAIVGGGCTTERHTFTGRTHDEVWTAMVAAAETPDYASGDVTERWTVMMNQVLVEDHAQRIEVYRRLKRELHRPGAKPLPEEREWRLRAELTANDAGDPMVKFVSRGMGVPAHARIEADRYFRDVSNTLGLREPEPEPVHVPGPERRPPSTEG